MNLFTAPPTELGGDAMGRSYLQVIPSIATQSKPVNLNPILYAPDDLCDEIAWTPRVTRILFTAYDYVWFERPMHGP